MPFPTRVIPTRSDIAEIHNNNAVQNVLDKAAVSNMVGLLQQMNTLSVFASEVFSNLLRDADKQLGRISKCRQRLTTIESRVQPIETGFLHQSPAYFYDNPYTGREYTRRDPLRGLLFRRDRSGVELNRRRNQAEPLPNLSSLDPYVFDKVPCGKKYSNPDYFMDQWLEAEKAKMEEARRLRKARKDKRAKKKMKRQSTKKIMKVQKKSYNALGAEFADASEKSKEPQFVETRQFDLEQGNPGAIAMAKRGKSKNKQSKASPHGGRSPPSASQAKTAIATQPSQAAQSQPGAGRKSPVPGGGPPAVHSVPGGGPKPPGGPPTVPSVPFSAPGGPPVPPPAPGGPPQFRQGAQMSGRPPPVPGVPGAGHPPPVPFVPGREGHNAAQPSYMPGFSAAAHAATIEAQPMPSRPKTAAEMASVSMQQADARMAEEQRIRMDQERAKKAALLPQRPTSLMANIRGGVSLKKAEIVKREAPADSRSTLLQQINKGTSLHHVDRQKLALHKKEKSIDPTSGIYAILQRRAFVADSSDEESDDSWGSESE